MSTSNAPFYGLQEEELWPQIFYLQLNSIYLKLYLQKIKITLNKSWMMGTDGGLEKNRDPWTIFKAATLLFANSLKAYFYAGLYLVDSTEGWHIHSLPPDGTCTTNTGGILTGPAVDDGIDQDLEGILGTKVNILKCCKRTSVNPHKTSLHILFWI